MLFTTLLGALLCAATTAAAPVCTDLSDSSSTCSVPGLQWAYFPVTYVGGDFDSTQFKNMTPQASGVTTRVGQAFFQPGSMTFYDSIKQLPNTFMGLMHRGYLFANQSGVYTFAYNNVDDTVITWLGDNAFKGYNDNNKIFRNDFGSPLPGPGFGSFTVRLTPGYYALRMLWVNGPSAGQYQYRITAPDGTLVLGSGTNANSAIVQSAHSLTGSVLAPPYVLNWGSEI